MKSIEWPSWPYLFIVLLTSCKKSEEPVSEAELDVPEISIGASSIEDVEDFELDTGFCTLQKNSQKIFGRRSLPWGRSIIY